MSLHGTTGNGVSRAVIPQGNAAAHTTLPLWAYPRAGYPPLYAASITSRSSSSCRAERLRRMAPTRGIVSRTMSTSRCTPDGTGGWGWAKRHVSPLLHHPSA